VPLPKRDPLRKARAKALAGKIAKVLDKKLKPTFNSVFKRFWANVHNQIYKELVQKGEDPTESKKKLAAANWWERDAYDKNGKRTGRPSRPFDGFQRLPSTGLLQKSRPTAGIDKSLQSQSEGCPFGGCKLQQGLTTLESGRSDPGWRASYWR
jgi:hypothetical protein